MVRVWVSDWQMDRSGTPFSVGSRVQLTVSAEIDAEWLSMVLGETSAGAIDYIEDRSPDPTLITISGSVSVIEAVHCEFDAVADERGLWPVPGTEKVETVAYAARWVPDEPPRRFVGWVVELNHHYVIPTG